MDFTNLNIIVTGASSGIGLLLADTLKKYNANVIGVYNKHKITSDIDSFKCDLSSETDIKNLYKYVINKYHKIDVLINCAALCLDNDIFDKTKNEFLNVLDVNLVGTFLMCKYFLKENEKGIIVNISSTDASTTYSPISIDYACSKAGVEVLTKALALRFKNAKILAIAPNWVNTDTVLSMDPEYLESELKRVNQKELIKKEVVVIKIIEAIVNSDYVSGDIIKVVSNNE